MRELLRTNDLVHLSFVQAVLRDGEIDSHVLDGNTSSMFNGAFNAMARRVMVHDDDYAAARRRLIAAGAWRAEDRENDAQDDG